MNCPNCQAEIAINREYCPTCGQRVTLAFSEIASSVKDDAAVRRGQNLLRFSGYAILVLGLAGTAIYALNDLWDRPLVYDGADLPALAAPPLEAAAATSILRPYHDPYGTREVPGQAPRGFGYRKPPLREELRDRNGGKGDLAGAVQRGLQFLQRQQAPDGSWPVVTEPLRIRKERDESGEFKWGQVGVTALALMAYLGEGETWWTDDKGKRGPYGQIMEKAIVYLVQNQDEQNGRFGPATGNFMYNHGLATLALAEAAGMSGDFWLRDAAQKGVDLIERTQGERGGWGYKDQIGARQDTSVSTWQVQALLAAREAGLKVSPDVLNKALAYYRSATDLKTGAVAYDFSDNQVRPNLIGVALMMRLQLGEPVSAPGIRMLAKKVQEYLPKSAPTWGRGWRESAAGGDSDRASAFDPYRLYFTTYGLFFYGGEDFQTWNLALTRALVELQDSDGAWRGNDVWTVKAGINYSTAMCVLTLQAYYRIH